MADVRELLTPIALATAQATIEAVERGDLQRKDTDFLSWKGDGTFTSAKRETLTVWNESDISSIAQRKQEENREILETCAKELAEAGGGRTGSVRGYLNQFLLTVVRRSADELSVQSVEELIGRLIHEVSGGAIEWAGRVWVSGIIATETPIQLKDGISLRRPEPRDFARRMHADLYGIPPHPLLSPDSILECYYLAPERLDLRQLVSAISLYRAAPVKLYLDHWTNNSVLRRNEELSYDVVKPSSPGLQAPELSTADGERMKSFVLAVADRLPLNPLGHHSDATWNGLKFYFRALHTASDNEERLFLAVTSLGASLLMGQGNSLLVRQRAAALLQFAGLSARDVFEQMSDAYKFRNRYAHGEDIKVEDLGRLRELCPSVMAFARLVIIKLLEFSDREKRKELLVQLDMSLLDRSER